MRKNINILFVFFLIFFFHSSIVQAQENLNAFPPPPKKALIKPLHIWATYYYVHTATYNNGNQSVPVLNKDAKDLGVSLSQKDWCQAAMEGTVSVKMPKGNVRVFNFSKLGQKNLTDCSKIFYYTSLKTRTDMKRTLFEEVTSYAPYGLGAKDNSRLVPLRSIAVDPQFIPLGSVLFIPKMAGQKIYDHNAGKTVTHDGYMFAVDTGNEIKTNHIDVFTGIGEKNPFPQIVTSNSKDQFDAYLVTDKTIINKMNQSHQLQK